MPSLTQQLAEFVVSAEFADLPVAAVESGWRSVADTLAVGWAGAAQASSHSVREMLVRQGGCAEGRVWGFGDRLPAGSAAFANSVFAAALDFDSINETAVTHSDLVSVPVALALCERERRSGEEFLMAVIIGNEVIDRLARAAGAHKGWFYTSLYGVFASAAVAARALGLDRRTTCHALGIALSQAAGTQQPIIERTLMKRIQGGLAAQAGVLAAFLAKSGITAPTEALEGRFGLHALYETGDASVILDGLGRTFAGSRMSLKKYPACACTHAAIEAALAIAEKLDSLGEDVSDAEVEITPYMHRLVGSDFTVGSDPQVSAQFSVQYAVACALLRRRFALADIAEREVCDLAVGEFARRIKVVVDVANDGLLGPARVTVKTHSGQCVTQRVRQVRGSLAQPLSRDELSDKFVSCISASESHGKGVDARKFFERIESVATFPDMSRFFEFMPST